MLPQIWFCKIPIFTSDYVICKINRNNDEFLPVIYVRTFCFEYIHIIMEYYEVCVLFSSSSLGIRVNVPVIGRFIPFRIFIALQIVVW